MEFKVHSKEKMYLAIMIPASLLMYGALIALLFLGYHAVIMYAAWVGAFMIFGLLGQIYLIGHVRGNAIKVSPKQFPEVFEVLKNQSEKLGLRNIPDMWLLQGNGILNAFATRFSGRNFVVLYSDVLAAAYQEGKPAVEFIVGHELGHIKRNHVGFLKHLLLMPARMIPFLGSAYSRSCEYTCDAIGYGLCPEGAEKGMLVLAAGRELYKKVNVNEMLITAHNERGFASWFAEIWSFHPHIVKRIQQFDRLDQSRLPANAFVHDKDKTAVRQFDDHV